LHTVELLLQVLDLVSSLSIHSFHLSHDQFTLLELLVFTFHTLVVLSLRSHLLSFHRLHVTNELHQDLFRRLSGLVNYYLLIG
jgi:hypothetical protein